MSFFIYFPIIIASLYVYPLGVQVDRVSFDYPPGYRQYIVDSRTYQFSLSWSDVDQYGIPQYFIDTYNTIGLGEVSVILGIKTTPVQYRLWPNEVAGPPRPEYYYKYAEFVCNLNKQFRFDAIEEYNEPNVSISLLDDHTQWYFGAWIGEGETPEIAGARYGQFTAITYPVIKQCNPDLTIYAGALLGNQDGIRFIHSAIDNGLRADAISFHAYLMDYSTNYAYPFNYANQIRQYTDLPLALTEMSIRRVFVPDDAQFRQNQVQYLQYVLQNSVFEYVGVYSMFNNWEDTEMIRNGLATPFYESWAGFGR